MRKQILWTLLLIGGFLFQTNLLFLAVGCSASFLLLKAAGLRIRFLPPLVMFSALTAAHLLVPAGEIIATIAGFPLTREALLLGLRKGLLLPGLLNLSRFAFSRREALPSGKRWSRILGEMLGIFSYLSRRKERFSRSEGWIKPLDDLLFEAESAADSQEHKGMPPLLPPAAISSLLWMLLPLLMEYAGILLPG